MFFSVSLSSRASAYFASTWLETARLILICACQLILRRDHFHIVRSARGKAVLRHLEFALRQLLPSAATLTCCAALEAFDRAFGSGKELNFSDDCGLYLEFANGSDPRVRLVPGHVDNIKVTLPIDLTIAEAIIRKNQATQAQHRTSLKGMRVVLVGGHGGLGNAVGTRLREVGVQVVSLSRRDGLNVLDGHSIESKLQAVRARADPSMRW